MKALEIRDGIYMLSVNAEGFLFEEMWDIPKGVSINSYIVKGEKTALIDGVCGWDGVPEQLYEMLDEIGVKIEDIDYLVVNHMEPDHSGWIKDFEKLKPNFDIYCTGMGKKLLGGFFGEADRVNIVKPGSTLDLGGGKVLEFIPHPNVHWPDTMMTFEQSTSTLFTCDMFGAYGKCEGNNFDDQFKDGDEEYFAEEQIRYYSNVLATFNKACIKAIEKAESLNPKAIAPGHGPIYRENPSNIINRYKEITGYLEGNPLDEVTIIYGSMYGMTEVMVDKIKEILERENVKYHVLRTPYAPIGEVLSKCIRSKAIIIAAPTYENGLFPAMAYAIDELGRKKFKGKKILCTGSFGWSGGSAKELKSIIEHHSLDWEFVPDVMFSGRPLDKHFEQMEESIKELLA